VTSAATVRGVILPHWSIVNRFLSDKSNDDLDPALRLFESKAAMRIMNSIDHSWRRRLLVAVSLLALTPLPLHAQCLQGSGAVSGPFFKTTGNPSLDLRFNQEAAMIASVFGVAPNLLLFNDSGSPNAFASPNNTYPGYTGTVFIGVTLLRDELWSMNTGEYAVAGILAHEFSHILQFAKASSLSGAQRELHADYMAGYYLGKKSYFLPTRIANFATSLYNKGDYAFWSPAHHGTPEERVKAMVAGFKNRGALLDDAFSDGEDFVGHLSDETHNADPDDNDN
jgi:hypothetical protein